METINQIYTEKENMAQDPFIAVEKSAKTEKSLKSELDDLKRHQDEITTSDLQGICGALARKYGVDDDDCLEYIYNGDTSVFKTKKSEEELKMKKGEQEEKEKLKAKKTKKEEELEDEDMEKAAEEEADEKEDPKEKKKAKKEKDDDDKDVEKEEELDEDEDDKDSKKKKKTKKGSEGSGLDPEEDSADNDSDGNTTSPGAGVPSTQNVAFGPKTRETGRNASGTTPGEESYTGKSANPELMKSPLFLELDGQIDGMKKAFDHKLDALNKSMNDRLANIQKGIDKVENFYKKAPLYKAVEDSVGAEAAVKKGIKEQIAEGKVRYSN